MALPLFKPATSLDTPGSHFDWLHSPAHGTAVLWERVGSGSGRWHKLNPGDPHIPALMASQVGQTDRYLTVNEFYAWRLVRNIKSLRAGYVDIDGSEDLPAAQEALRDARLPQPTLVIFSGRGMHLYWLHEPVPGAVLPVWQRCQDALLKALLPIGGDPAAKDCTRVLRLAGTINSKSSTAVRGLIIDPEPYSFRHLCNEVLGYREPRERPIVRDLATARAERGLPAPKGSIYARWHLVYQDLLKIADWHLLGGIPEGARNDWLFLSAVSLSWFANPATLKSELERQAKAWTPGLTIAEVRSAIKSPLERAARAAEGNRFEWQGEPCDPRYKFRRETLLEWMQPIIPPDLAPQLRAIVSSEVKAKHEREREAKRDRVAEGRHKASHSDSQERAAPWEAMGLSRATYFRKKALGTLT